MDEKAVILKILSRIIDPDANTDIVSLNYVTGLVVKKDALGFALEVPAARGARAEPLRRQAEETLRKAFPDRKINVVLTAHGSVPAGVSRKALPEPEQNGLAQIRYIIAVASGKGGVGKSTVAVNLASALQQQGLKVGLMDADIYGPSVPKMTGHQGQVGLTEEKMIRPLRAHHLTVMSMGFMVNESAALVWRGPMVISAIRQMLHQVAWGDLDILVVDMPPGTGDAQLTLSQKAPLAGAVIVSTPQDIALMDVRRGVEMFSKVGVPVLGVIENMSYYKCPQCGDEAHIFGHGGAESMAGTLAVPFLGQIPLDIDVRILSDAGTPVVLEKPDHIASRIYKKIAADLWQHLNAAPRPSRQHQARK